MSRLRELIAKAKAMGWTVELKDFCEDAETPGILGAYAGVCVYNRKAIKVRTKGFKRAKIIAILEHELEHARGAERGTDRPEFGLKCGGIIGKAAIRQRRKQREST